MTATSGGPVYTTVYDTPQIVECACPSHECPELAEGSPLCIACSHGYCRDDTE